MAQAPPDNATEMSLVFFRKAYAPQAAILGVMQRGPFQGYLNAFGGKRNEEDSSIDACADRESYAESGGKNGSGNGLVILAKRKLGIMQFSFTFKPVVHDVHIYECTEFSGAFEDTDELKDIRWRGLEASLPLMMPGDRLWVPHLIAGRLFRGACVYEKDADGKYQVRSHAVSVVRSLD